MNAGDGATSAPTAETPQTTPSSTDTNTNRRQPFPQGFLDTISTGWATRPESAPLPRAQSSFAAARRARVSEAFGGKRLVIPAGEPKQRRTTPTIPSAPTPPSRT